LYYFPRNELSDARIQENGQTEWHIPGQNFSGPGTKVVQRILNGVLPNNKTDAVTMLHDIDYLKYNGDMRKSQYADALAIMKSDWSLPGLITKFGLSTRSLYFPDQFIGPLGNYSQEDTSDIGYRLERYVRNTPKYADILNKYGI
jgi:hypothetical protein